MAKKLNPKDILKAMKQSITKKDVAKPLTHKPLETLGDKGIRIRDMRQESMDHGSYGASEYFREGQQ